MATAECRGLIFLCKVAFTMWLNGRSSRWFWFHPTWVPSLCHKLDWLPVTISTQEFAPSTVLENAPDSELTILGPLPGLCCYCAQPQAFSFSWVGWGRFLRESVHWRSGSDSTPFSSAVAVTALPTLVDQGLVAEWQSGHQTSAFRLVPALMSITSPKLKVSRDGCRKRDGFILNRRRTLTYLKESLLLSHGCALGMKSLTRTRAEQTPLMSQHQWIYRKGALLWYDMGRWR